MLSWTGDKGFQLYELIDWEMLGKDKDKWKEVLEAFQAHFKPCQTVMQSWYQLGSLYSSNCKDQTEFMTRIKELAKEGGFTQQEELVKFLFVIHNTDPKVRETWWQSTKIIIQTRFILQRSRQLKTGQYLDVSGTFSPS